MKMMCSALIQSMGVLGSEAGNGSAVDVAVLICCLSATYFPVSKHHVFERRQAIQSDWTTGMQFIVRDADFGAQPEFEAVGKTGRCVNHDRGRIDLTQEAHRA